ncbi:MAG: hypothetical protein ABR571_11610 [Jatrophihabitans sp.]|uniref:hypothetical protein n=1 Tax=Jatrophihabitans sp. TaxID=1932789 RepID=UPI0039121D63
MNDKSSRLVMWCGPLFAALFIGVGFFLSGDEPGEKASGATVIKFYAAHQGRGMISVFGTPLLVALLLLFASGLRSRARRQGKSDVGATVMLAGAVLWSSGILLGSTIELALLSASDHKQADVAHVANVLNNADWLPFIGGIAIFMLGAGLAVLTSRFAPAWLGWVAIVVGVVSLAGPGGFVGFFAAPLWVLVVGIMLAVRRNDAATATAEPAVARPVPSAS